MCCVVCCDVCGFVVDSVLFVGGRPCAISIAVTFAQKSGQQHFQVPGLQNENSKFEIHGLNEAAQRTVKVSKLKV